MNIFRFMAFNEQQFDQSNKKNKFKIFILFATPFVVCDFVYGFFNLSCIKQNLSTNKKFHVNLQSYLLANAIVQLIAVILIILLNDRGNTFINKMSNANYEKIYRIITILFYFLCAWTIVGAVAYYDHTNIFLCNDNFNAYMQVSLILKLIFYTTKGYVFGSGDIDDNDTYKNYRKITASTTIVLCNCFDFVFLQGQKFKNLIIVAFPFAICDIVFGSNNSKCLTDFKNEIGLSLQQYLIIHSIIQFGILFFGYISPLNDKFDQLVVFLSGFSSAWTIAGSILFFDCIDQSICNNQIAQYMKVSLIIKLILYVGLGFVFGPYDAIHKTIIEDDSHIVNIGIPGISNVSIGPDGIKTNTLGSTVNVGYDYDYENANL